VISFLLQHGVPAGVADAPSQVMFGLDAMLVAGVLFAACYLMIIGEWFNRANVALIAGGLMILTGVLNQHQAIAGIDFNTLGLLIGMMLIVSVTRESGVFQYLAIWSAKRARAKPWGILVLLGMVTAVLSAMLDNVTTVLLIVPVTLVITDELEVPPYPFLFAEILFSNIGGTATLIGDPPNILIGSQVEYIHFADFILHLAPIVPVILAATLLPIWLLWGRKMSATPEAMERVMAFDEKEAIRDVTLLKKSLFVLALVLVGFLFGHPLGLEPATVAMTGAALLLVLNNLGKDLEKKNDAVHHFYGHVEWTTIFFFVGLFVVVAGVEQAGLLDLIAEKVLHFSGGDVTTIATAVLWVSSVASAIVDNIPFVATMIPVLHKVVEDLGLSQGDALGMWWALALGACLGGNGSLIGASANLIVAGYAERAGHRIKFLTFLKHAFPMMILSIVIAHAYLWLRYLG